MPTDMLFNVIVLYTCVRSATCTRRSVRVTSTHLRHVDDTCPRLQAKKVDAGGPEPKRVLNLKTEISQNFKKWRRWLSGLSPNFSRARRHGHRLTALRRTIHVRKLPKIHSYAHLTFYAISLTTCQPSLILRLPTDMVSHLVRKAHRDLLKGSQIRSTFTIRHQATTSRHITLVEQVMKDTQQAAMLVPRSRATCHLLQGMRPVQPHTL